MKIIVAAYASPRKAGPGTCVPGYDGSIHQRIDHLLRHVEVRRYFFFGALLRRRLRRGEPCHRHSERRATDIRQSDLMAERDARRVAAVFAADA